MYIEGDVPYVTGNNGNNNGFGFGNGWEGLIGLALVAGLFGGWGNGGFGGNRGGSFCGTPATQADLANGFAQNTIQRGIDDIILGQAQAINYTNQGFAGLNNTLTTNFANLNTALCSLGYNEAQLVNGLSTQLAGCCCDLRQQISDCCCTTNRNIDAVRYENAKNTCDIIRAGQDNTRAILDYLTGEKISSLQAENSGLKAQISNDRQSRFIIDELRNGNCPVPAYITCDPRVPVNYNTCC